MPAGPGGGAGGFRARSVTCPAMPSGNKACLFWNSLTAASVACPKWPSAASRYPALDSARCKSVTSGPPEFSRSMPAIGRTSLQRER